MKFGVRYLTVETKSLKSFFSLYLFKSSKIIVTSFEFNVLITYLVHLCKKDPNILCIVNNIVFAGSLK